MSIVLGTNDKMSVVDMLLSGEMNEEVAPRVEISPLEGSSFEPMTVKRFPRARAYVKIEDGCDCRCTYCAISSARGPVRSKRREEVISEVSSLGDSTCEVVLTGIELGCYGRDLGGGESLPELIRALDSVGGPRALRLGSLSPELITPELCSALSESKMAVPHLSIQSGSDRILGLMRRRYNSKMLRSAAAALRSTSARRVNLTADLIVGFPTETEEDFLDTLSLVSELELLDAHVFAYSRRAGTPAAEMAGQIPEEIKRERSARLSREVERVKGILLSRMVEVGGAYPAILESYLGDGLYSAHTDSYVEIRGRYPEGHEGEAVLARPVRVLDGVLEVEFS